MNLSTIDSVQLLHDNLLVTRQNLNDFFITVSAILVFGNIFIILDIFYFIARFNLIITLEISDASRILAHGDRVGSIEERHKHPHEINIGCL